MLSEAKHLCVPHERSFAEFTLERRAQGDTPVLPVLVVKFHISGRLSMSEQQRLFSRDAPHPSTPILPILSIVVIALVAALVLYAALAIANYTIGGQPLRGNMRSLEYPLAASFNLGLAIVEI